MAVRTVVSNRTGELAYAAVVDYRDVNDKRRQAKRHALTPRAAREAEAELLLKRKRHELPGQSAADAAPTERGVTVSEYLADWLKRQREIKASTQTRYRQLIALLNAQVGDVELERLTTRQIQDAYHAIEDGGLTSKTVLNVHRVLRKALQDAVEIDELVKRNVTIKTIAPRPKRYEAKILTRDELDALFAAADETQHGPLFRLLAWTGLRLGEALGLRWAFIDLKAGTLTVRQTLNAAGEFSEPKTSRSRRRVDLSPETVSLLDDVRKRQEAERDRAGDVYKNDDLVFANTLGEPRSQSAVDHAWRAIADKAGVSARVHDLRHAHASYLLADGWEVSAVAERLGHAQTSTTLNIYGHALPSRRAEMAKSIDRIYSAK